MGWRIISHYGIAKATEAVADFAAAVDSFDIATTNPPQRRVIEVEHAKLSGRLVQLGAEIARESRETARLRSDYEIYLQAAHLLAVDLERAMDGRPGRANENTLQTEASLAKLIGRLEELKPELDRETSDDSDSASWLAAIESVERTLGTMLRDAEQPVMEDPKNRPEHVRRAAAFAGAISTMSVAIDEMIKQAAGLPAQTGIPPLDAGVLRLEQLGNDPRIGAAIDRVRRGTRNNARDLTARLSALGAVQQAPRLRAVE